MTSNSQATMPRIPRNVADAFEQYPRPAQTLLQNLRTLLFEEAERLGVGPIEETLKWGEPAYLTSVTNAGSTIRLAWKSGSPNDCSMFFNCQTDLVGQAQSQFPDEFEYSGKRGVSIAIDQSIPEVPVRMLFAMALTYHLKQR